jgi:hypothetical protein
MESADASTGYSPLVTACIVFYPLRGHFDVPQIETQLLAMRYAARDRFEPGTILVADTRERIEHASHERERDATRFSYATDLVTVTPEDVVVALGTRSETARRFAEWVRARYAVRIEDGDYGDDVTRLCEADLHYFFGEPPEPDPRAFVPPDAPFPLGRTLDEGRFVVTRALSGTPDAGVYAGFDTEYRNRKEVLVTLGPPQTRELAVVRDELEEVVCSGEVLFVGALEHDGERRHDGLVQDVPLAFTARELLDGPAERAIALELATLAATAAYDLRTGMRPELLYVDEELAMPLTRYFSFLAGAERRCYGVAPPWDTFYLAPEVLADAQRATERSDVFTICAMLAEWISGEHPFAGEGAAANAIAIATNRRRPFHGPEDVRELVDAGLAPDAAKRPSRDELLAALERLRCAKAAP